MINLRPKLEDMIASVKEHIALLEQANRDTEKFEMLLITLESKQTKRQGRQWEVKDVKQEVKPNENEIDFEIDLDPQMDVEYDFEPSQPVLKWDDLIRKNENGCEDGKC